MNERKAGAATREATVPYDREAIRRVLERQRFDVRRPSIRQLNNLVNSIEAELGVRFVRMEFGIPGLPLSPVAIEAEAEALRTLAVGSTYAPFEGVPALKEEAARFARLYLGIDVPATSCIPTVGAMEGCFASLAVATRRHRDRRTVLFLEPGFPVNKLQTRFLGVPTAHIDLYDHRGEKLLRAVEQRAARGDLCAILWSSPNNPTWVVLEESELEGLGRICDRHDLIGIEDLAYFGMDVRHDYFTPGEPPYQPTVLRYTERAITILSSSKIFSYAGQRIALLIVPPGLMELESPDLVEHLGASRVGAALLHGVLYPLTASVPQSPQYGLLALLRAVNAGDRSLFAAAAVYARRAALMKRAFLDNGFRLVYDRDLDRPLSDGFYFTVAYPGFEHGADLLHELLHYGISAITLETAGSIKVEGLRACVSLVGDEQLEALSSRLAKFREDHPASESDR
jgi:aspartate/methionine/tyrosine aminotransferase